MLENLTIGKKNIFKRKKMKLSLKIVLIIGFLTFAGALSHDYINYDDAHHIYDNELVTTLSFSTIKDIFNQRISDTYIPLTVLSWAAEYTFIDIHPAINKFINILLHLWVVSLVYKLAVLLKFPGKAALLSAFIFCIHPIHVESVVWATERKDVLYSVFYMYSLIFYVKYLNANVRFSYILALGSVGLAILAKPMAVSLPWILLLIQWYHIKKVTWKDKIPFALAVFPIAAITWIGTNSVMAFSWPDSIWIWPWCAVAYLTKFFFPVNIHPLYAFNFFNHGMTVYYIALILFILVILSLFWSKSRTYRFAIGFYALSIFFLWRGSWMPVDVISDRFMYLPCLGLCLWCGQLLIKKIVFKCSVRHFLILGLMLCLALKAYTGVTAWRNSDIFYKAVLKHNPYAILAWQNRGASEYYKERYDSAIKYFSWGITYAKSIDDFKGIEELYYWRGRTYAKKKEFKAAYSDLAQVKRFDIPDFLFWRAYIYMQFAEYEKALRDLDVAIRFNPDDEWSKQNRNIIIKKLYKKG